SPSSREEDQAVLADLELVAGVEIGLLDPVPVQERAVQAAEILDREAARAAGDDRVPARHGDVVEKDVAVRRSPDRRLRALERELLARAAAAGAHDEGRPLDPDVLELAPLLLELFERDRLRRVVDLLHDEERAAARAVVRGLEVLEPALRAVDVTHV